MTNKFNFSFADFIFHISQFILYLLCSNLLISSFIFFAGFTINQFLFPISIICGAILLFAFYGKKVNGWFIFEIIVSLIMIYFFIRIAENIYDCSWDGNMYHKTAIGLLANGWNPIKELPSFKFIGAEEIVSSNMLWIESYCKTTWIFGASLYVIRGNIECGKIYTLLGIVIAYGITYYYIAKQNKHHLFRFLFPLAVACNPIALQQWDSFYIDGYLHTMLFILVIALIMYETSNNIDPKISLSLIASSMIILGNIKFTGLMYGGLFCIAYYMYHCFCKFKEGKKDWLISCIQYACFYISVAITTILITGNCSYLTNILRHHNPLYPLIGADKVDIMTSNSPFTEENHFRNLFISLFSYMANSSNHELKIPFTYNWEYEAPYRAYVDARISGFGIFFGGIIIVSVIIILFAFCKNKENQGLLLTNLIVCLGLTFGIKESWWARYSPYIYGIVLTALYQILDINSNLRPFVPISKVSKIHSKPKTIFTIIGILFSCIILINNALPLTTIKDDYYNTNRIQKELADLSLQENVDIYNETFEGVYFNFIDSNVDFTINPILPSDSSSIIFDYEWTYLKIQ